MNHRKFYEKICFHKTVEETIEEVSMKAGITLRAEFSRSNEETKTKSILGSLVLALIKDGDESFAVNAQLFEDMVKEHKEEIYKDYQVILDLIIEPGIAIQEERAKRRRIKGTLDSNEINARDDAMPSTIDHWTKEQN